MLMIATVVNLDDGKFCSDDRAFHLVVDTPAGVGYASSKVSRCCTECTHTTGRGGLTPRASLVTTGMVCTRPPAGSFS